ncbi:hypothetical protein IJT93_03520 [bacterium]|nr:hypothetical protein [bacterium]
MNIDGLTAAAVKFITELTLPWLHVLSGFTCILYVLIGIKLCSLLRRAHKLKTRSLSEGGSSAAGAEKAGECEGAAERRGADESYEIKESAFGRTFFFLCCLGAIGFALYLSFVVIPFSPQVFDDEISFWSLAEGLGREGLYLSKLKNPPMEFFLPIPPACPYVLSLFFDLCGVCEKSVFICAFASAAWGMIAACAWAFLYWRKAYCAFIFSFFLFLLPIHVRLMNTNALENGTLALIFTFLFICELAPFSRDLFRDAECGEGGENAAAGELACFEKLCIYGASLTAAWLADWRMENAPVLLPICLLVYLCHDPKRFKIFRNPHLYWALALASVFSLPGLACDAVGMLKGYYLFYDDPANLSRLTAQNSVHNWLYWIDGSIHPLIYTLLAAFSLFFLKDGKKFLWLGAWLVSVLFYCRIPSADFSLLSHLDSWRNAIFPASCLIIAAVCFVREARRLFSSTVKYTAAVLLILGGIFWQLFSHWSFVTGSNMYIEEYRFFRSLRCCSFLDGGFLFYDTDSEIPCSPVGSALKYRLASEREWFEAVWDKEDDGLKEAPVVLRDIEGRCRAGFSTVIYRSCAENSADGSRYLELYDRYFLYKKLTENVGFGVHHDIIVIKGLTPEAKEWIGRGGGK